MPNWCYNHLRILGPKTDADELRAFMTTPDGQFDFEAIDPLLKEFRQESERGWQFYDPLLQFYWSDTTWLPEEKVTNCNAVHALNFTTAWRPAVEIVIALSSRFPSLVLQLHFNEPFGGFRGFADAQKGNWDLKHYEHYIMEEEAMKPSPGLVAEEMYRRGATRPTDAALTALALKTAKETDVSFDNSSEYVAFFEMAFNHAWDQMEADPDPDFQMA